jgi:hypothetical protein
LLLYHIGLNPPSQLASTVPLLLIVRYVPSERSQPAEGGIKYAPLRSESDSEHADGSGNSGSSISGASRENRYSSLNEGLSSGSEHEGLLKGEQDEVDEVDSAAIAIELVSRGHKDDEIINGKAHRAEVV